MPVGIGERIMDRARAESTTKTDIVHKAIERYLSSPAPKRDEFDD